ncbi:unnamed protein product [Toxocara canis]|uniref:Uncharacterized protein n=1 Tax=Toxocara canis TaxID=6265 RepID=A0A183U2X5_TOXCA|nr:unnamed protein product [Toxocara canis]
MVPRLICSSWKLTNDLLTQDLSKHQHNETTVLDPSGEGNCPRDDQASLHGKSTLAARPFRLPTSPPLPAARTAPDKPFADV